GVQPRVAKKVKIQPGEGVAGFVFQTGRPLLVNNLSSKKSSGWKPRQKGYATSSFVSIPVIASPLHIGEEMIGVLNLTDRRDGSRFSPRDLKMLELMANQAAGIFRTRQLMDTLKEHEAYHRELQIVSEIQERLIPSKFPKLDGIQIGGHCQLSPRGGGDYFDVVQVGKSLRGVIADVSGHNVGSAITMASFRSMVRSLSFDPNTPGEWLRALRWAMHEELLRLHQFISCWVWEFNPPGSFILSGAGHPPVLIYRAKGKKWETLASHHLPLGLEDDSRIQNLKAQLKRGDVIIFYTDGLFDPRMRETGLERDNIMDFLQNNLRFTPQKMIGNLFELLDPHLNLLKAPDDVAVLALKRK
ncbi:MAG: GAF domain-containing SpoIIE family protein phosphatase, partial [bacterium]|nr:GAF domain-containing SpoIIE family protein phosphatase [bacterium]